MLKDIFSNIADLFAEFFKKEESWILLFFLAGIVTIPFFTVSDFEKLILSFLELTWWFWAFFPLFYICRSTFLHIRREHFKKNIKTTLLELRIPREIEKSAKAMEQILTTMHSLVKRPKSISDRYFKGKVTLWFSLEIVSFKGNIYFYIRTPENNKSIIETAFFSYYPDVEISEVNDYMDAFPKNFRELENQGKDIFGMELVLSRDEAYPIKTYEKFESVEDSIKFDPISNLLEVLGKTNNREVVCVHILIEPSRLTWREKWDPLLSKLREPKTIDIGKGEDKKTVSVNSPDQNEIVKDVEKNLSKPAFETLIRIFYMSPKDIFSDQHIKSGIIGAFNQYGEPNLNSFKGNSKAGTGVGSAKFLFGKKRSQHRKSFFLYKLRKRALPPEEWIEKLLSSYLLSSNFGSKCFSMSAEGIATIFHPPTSVVLTTPHMKRIESKKSGPQVGLDIFGSEEEIEKYK